MDVAEQGVDDVPLRQWQKNRLATLDVPWLRAFTELVTQDSDAVHGILDPESLSARRRRYESR